MFKPKKQCVYVPPSTSTGRKVHFEICSLATVGLHKKRLHGGIALMAFHTHLSCIEIQPHRTEVTARRQIRHAGAVQQDKDLLLRSPNRCKSERYLQALSLPRSILSDGEPYELTYDFFSCPNMFQNVIGIGLNMLISH